MEFEMNLAERMKSHFWFHSIDLGDGLVTPGIKSAEVHAKESEAFFGDLDLTGKSVLDIGAWNGVYSFEAKKRGARRVVASDAPTWMDPAVSGHGAFSFAREALGLDVEDAVIAVDDMTPQTFGETFDVVLFLGVFYHLQDPLLSLKRAAAMSHDQLIVETHMDLVSLGVPAMRYYVGDELNGDSSNYWGPNPLLVVELLKAEGFGEVEVSTPLHPSRGIFKARRTGPPA
ncbi:DUF1698 domain-containing protein [Brevundimonas sp.]|uniref:class I SAM-dependent methyltransferase n=1 Tax=Brevundimonas sp. TaxID=1871086 RepID=UPI00286C1E27|nr:DUF1698 domain-containing protein [Brevundimonas sp.]